ncbi:MAG: hypothetical protein CBB68_05110 [Rhodospirillaceae bacterium TMED8]|nr:methyltransferase type 11 [Magnetovibrio sp.]OUT51731.1 MAG: hypothetical protein CBB68_05110 [Rhodospirillaceae bacterium TMED8]|tara:strand:+ start:236 stop:859 length:624 start_codon:yes stop_codon:yes gene_type:complete
MIELPQEYLRRVDETDDAIFYSQPRIVKHIDDPACSALTDYFREVLPPNGVILDLMSSYASHLPEDIDYKGVVGLGMNKIELEANSRLSSYLIHNLAFNPKLPFDDNTFDACTLTVSVQYLVHPISVFQDIGRVLRPNGPCIVSFSNRCFPTKAVCIWHQLTHMEHAQLVAHYFDGSEVFSPSETADISPNPGNTDPLTVVWAKSLN